MPELTCARLAIRLPGWIRGLCLDLNGVLVDDERVHFAAFTAAMAAAGVTVDAGFYARYYAGRSDEDGIAAHLHALALPAEAFGGVAALAAAKTGQYLRLLPSRVRGFGCALSLLDAAVRCGLPTVVVTASVRAEAQAALAAVGAPAVPLVAAGETAVSKPEPGPYLAALELLHGPGAGSLAAATVAVEDSRSGVLSARGAGLRVCAVGHSIPLDSLPVGPDDLATPCVPGRLDRWPGRTC